MSYAPLADEVNPPFSKATPAARVTRSGTVTYRQSEEDAEHDSGDLGDLPRFSRQDKGKGKARAFDVERGPEPVDASAAYPPISSEEEDERRIQANLSRLAARDQAERRARQSRLFPRPLSIWPDRDRIAGDNPSQRNSSEDASAVARSRSHTPTSPRPPTGGIVIRDPVPRRSPTPASPHSLINPFDTPDERAQRSPAGFTDPNSPDPSFGYAGPAWHGGAAAPVNTSNGAAEPSRLRKALPDKWWKALCAWGADLDGGHDDPEDGGQAGRTNPNE